MDELRIVDEELPNTCLADIGASKSSDSSQEKEEDDGAVEVSGSSIAAFRIDCLAGLLLGVFFTDLPFFLLSDELSEGIDGVRGRFGLSACSEQDGLICLFPLRFGEAMSLI